MEPDGSIVTCTACHLRLVGSDSRREHYRSDLHRVNLKRKVGGLGPLSSEEFANRLAALQTEQDVAQRQREAKFCVACSKKFASEKALDNHNRSRRHLERVRSLAEGGHDGELSTVGGTDEEDMAVDTDAPGETEAVEDDEAVAKELARRVAESCGLAETECVFDGSVQASVEENLSYMAKSFGFFVPYVEQLRDPEGLLKYLGQKVGIGYACVECDRGFGDVKAAQKHMRDKSHCRMTREQGDWMEEYGEFYNFGDEEEGDEDEGWEEVSGDEAALVDLAQSAEVADSGADDVLVEDVGLVVNGKVVGHRSLRRYYKQSAGGAVDSRAAVVANRVVKEYRLLGWEGKKKDPMLVRSQRREARRDLRFQLVVGGQNYYCRKARFKQSMAVFNSGYRA